MRHSDQYEKGMTDYRDAMDIFEEMITKRIKTYRIEVSKENNGLIREVQGLIKTMPGFSYRPVGMVGGKKWLVISDTTREYGEASPAGELIVVDFKAKKILSRSAA